MKTRLIIILSITLVFFASCKNQTQQQDIKLNVMSFNIRYDNPADGENNWQYRKDIAGKVVTMNDIDLLGAQEVLENQLYDLDERLPDYEWVGVGREDGIHKGEHSSIFYKKSRFDKLDSGDFWLSETPEKVSVGWDAALERIASWVKLREKESGIEFLFMNVHLDHVGKEARRNSIKLLLDNAALLGKDLPVILSGDFNARPTSEVIQGVVGEDVENRLNDSKLIAKVVEGAEGTFHAFKENPDFEEGRIDYIFVNDGIIVEKYRALEKKLDGIFISDHIPIMAELTIQK